MESDFVGALTQDIATLSMQDDYPPDAAPAEVAESPESPSPQDSSSGDEFTEPTQPEADQASGTGTRDEVSEKPQQPDAESLDEQYAQLQRELEFEERLDAQGLWQPDPVAEQAAHRQFRDTLDVELAQTVSEDIRRTAPPGFAGAPAELQERFIQATHAQIQKWALGDPKLRATVQEALSRGYTRRGTVDTAVALLQKTQDVLPGALRSVLGRPEFASLRVAAKPAQPEGQGRYTKENWRHLSDDEILNRMSTEEAAVLAAMRTRPASGTKRLYTRLGSDE
jgi:hypothetical protein